MRFNDWLSSWGTPARTLRPSRATPRLLRSYVPQLERLEERLVLDDTSAGVNGINARNLTLAGGAALTGSGIAIGQVESGRVGRTANPPEDNADNSHPDVSPIAVFLRDGNPVQNNNVTDHATGVAGVIIANGAAHQGMHKGIAPGAKDKYYSSAAAPTGNLDQKYDQFLRSMQKVATHNTGDARAINLSFSLPGDLNGSSLLTLGLDWSSRVHDVLYVKSRGNSGDGTGVPTDNFNGINVAGSEKVNDVFSRVWGTDFTNALNGRRLTNIVAPSRDILVPPIRGGQYQPANYTSFATPHVTGTVALLQQYADDRLAAGAAGWDTDARHPEVMKAVLMNSADKLDGVHGSTRTILKSDGTNWLQSDARDSADNAVDGKLYPLDNELGTGHLNAQRALQQFSPGETDTPAMGAGVPVIGWDFGNTNGASTKKYPFASRLKGGSYVSLTLVWERIVTLNDTNANGQYDTGETFTASFLKELDLFLLPKGATSTDQSIWSTDGFQINLEHIFFKLPDGDNDYEFWVRQYSAGDQPYAVAWWAVAAPQQEEGSGSGPVSPSTSIPSEEPNTEDDQLLEITDEVLDEGTPLPLVQPEYPTRSPVANAMTDQPFVDDPRHLETGAGRSQVVKFAAGEHQAGPQRKLTPSAQLFQDHLDQLGRLDTDLEFLVI